MLDELWLMLLIVFAPVAVGMLTLLLPLTWMLPRVLLALAGPAASLAGLWRYIDHYGFERGRVAAPWMPQLHLDWAFLPDSLGLFFALLIAGIGLLILLYGRGYLGPDPHALRRFYPLITLFMTAMLGLVLADDFLLLLIFWELTSISSFLLIGWDTRDAKSVRNALQALIVTGSGGLALLAGLVWLGASTGAWSFTSLQPVSGSPAMLAAFALIYLGIAAKSAQWPLHFWLPGAMLAPTPISAYLHSAAMVKAGIYLLARLWPQMSGLEAWPILVIGVGGVTMALGAFMALQRDVLKQILAYTTISQLGLLAAAFGLACYSWNGEPNIIWGNAQVLNHAIYKAPLFMLAGGVAHVFGKATLSELRGALRLPRLRLYAVLFLLALIALAALPPTLGFLAKEAFLYQIWHAWEASGHWPIWALLAAAVATSMFNVAILVRFAWTFLARPASVYEESPRELAVHDEAAAHHHEGPSDSRAWTTMLWLPAAMLIALQWVGGLAGPSFARIFLPFESTPLYWQANDLSLQHAFAEPGVPLLLSAIGIGLGLLLGLSPLLRKARADWHDRLFPAVLDATVLGGARLFRAVQHGWFPGYMLVTALGLAAVLFWTGYLDWRAGGGLLPRDLDPLPSFTGEPAAWLLCGLVCAGALVMIVVRDRIARVLVLGTVGFSVTGIYYVYFAPDLALTQLSIEIVSLILFLLVLDLLPRAHERARRIVSVRVAVALVVGAAAAAVTLWASTGPRPQRPPLLAGGAAPATLGDYFLRNSYTGIDTAYVDPGILGAGVVARGEDHLRSFGSKAPSPPHEPPETGTVTLHKGGGGSNVVNVILVDFRGFDTLGEITVLAIAAMGVWTLLRKPPTSGDFEATDNRSEPFDDTFPPPDAPPPPPPASSLPRGRSPVHSETIATSILRSAVRLLVPLALVFAVYLFFKGHQTPGGGFVAGLATAVALLVYRMCFGCEALYRLLPFRERTLVGIGLLLAVATAALPLLWGLPFLTSNNGHLPLPGGSSYHWATVTLFDAGVFIVVVGSVVGMIDAIARELE